MIGISEKRAVLRVLNSGMLAQGQKVKDLERQFSKKHDVEFSSAVNSGTSGLHLALLTLGLTSGDEVLVPAISFAATANAVMLAGGRPVFVDIDLKTFNLNLQELESKINSRTKAIIPVHLFGSMVDMESLISIAKSKDLAVIEDAAQAHGARLHGKSAGSFGDFGVFSMYATKNITSGEGGIVTSKKMESKKIIDELRNQGMSDTYVYERPGLNNRMTEMQAAIGVEQLKRLDGQNRKRRTNAEDYENGLPRVLIRQRVLPGSVSSYHQFTVLAPGCRDDLADYLSSRGIQSRIFYPQPLNELPHFSSESNALENASEFSKNCLSLPVGPHLRRRAIAKVITEVNKFFGEQ